MLSTCLASIARHTVYADFKVSVVWYSGQGEFDAQDIVDQYPFATLEPVSPEIPAGSSSRIHGAMLDDFVPTIEEKHFMTLDSNCFPIADGWLSDLVEMVENGAGCAGILHPWAPPPEDMPKSKIEYRVRSQHCWETTHVACQLMETELFKSLGVNFNAGDDTGLLIPAAIKQRGLKIDGFLLSRCPNVSPDCPFGLEYNRYVCLIFGDKVYHQGGFTRTATLGDDAVFDEYFEWARELILAYEGAEFLLDDENSYVFQYDIEEKIAEEKMQRLFGLRSQRLENAL
jgi:hypothetical protein